MTKHLENLTRGLYMEFKVNFSLKTTLTITGCVVCKRINLFHYEDRYKRNGNFIYIHK